MSGDRLKPLVKAAQLGELGKSSRNRPGRVASWRGYRSPAGGVGLMIARDGAVVPGMPTAELLSRRSAIR